MERLALVEVLHDRLRQVRQELTMQQDSFNADARLCAIDLLEQVPVVM